jgi:hypothetical protein
LAEDSVIAFFFSWFQTPLGHFNLKEAKVQDIDQTSDSSEENEGSEVEGDVPESGKLTISITPPHQGPTYLLFPTRAEKVNDQSKSFSYRKLCNE